MVDLLEKHFGGLAKPRSDVGKKPEAVRPRRLTSDIFHNSPCGWFDEPGAWDEEKEEIIRHYAELAQN